MFLEAFGSPRMTLLMWHQIKSQLDRGRAKVFLLAFVSSLLLKGRFNLFFEMS
jgi:hypothetical protein